MPIRSWGAFLLLGSIWGSSFLWIKIALDELGPFTLVGFRLLFGALGMLLVLLVRRPAFPRDSKTWLMLALMGLTNTALPFVLISWGEIMIDSSVASILNSTTPLFTLVIAHFFLSDERMTVPRALGLVLGFVGILLLFSRDLGLQGFQTGLMGQAAVLAAAISYAGSSVFARRAFRKVPLLIQAAVPLFAADVLIWGGALAIESPLKLPDLPITWIALVWLGLLGSCVAYLLYFYLINNEGSTRSTLVTYMFPVIGVALGVLFLNEKLDMRLIIGALMVVAGIGVVNWKPRPARGQDEA
ncbi:MAG: EamA family transporter [Anaerolineales bacterium]|jgi:drug/metabolite transporter (DMT)-like permease